MAGKTITAGIRLEGEAQFKAGIKDINNEMKQLGAEAKLLDQTFKGQEKSVEAVRAKNENYAKSLEQAKAKQEAYAQQIEKTKKSEEDIKKNLEQLTQARDQEKKKLDEMKASGQATDKEIKKQEQTVEKYNKAIRQGEENLGRCSARLQKYQTEQTKAATKVAEFSNKIKENNKALDESGKSIQSADNAINGMATALAAAGVTQGIKEIAETLKECADAAQTFETSFAKVSTIADTSKVSSDQLKQQMMDLSNATGKSVNDIAEATYQAISASVDTADAVDFVGTASKLAAGGFTDQATAVDTLTTVINAYGKDAKDATHISDLLVETQNKGKTTVGQLAQVYGQVIPEAASAGMAFEDLSTAMAVTTKNGMNTAVAGTSIRSLLGELAKEGSGVSNVLKDETGQSFAELMQSGKSLGDVMQILMDHVNGNKDAFKNLFGNVRSGGAAYFLAKEGADGYNAELERMYTVSGQAAQAAATMADTAQVAENKFKNSQENLKIAIGDVLLPVLTELRNSGTKAFQWMTDLAKEHPEVVAAATGIITALTGVVGAMTAIITIQKVVIPAIDAMKTSLMGLAETNPAILAITGIAIAVAGVVAAFETWNAYQAEIEGTQQNLRKTFEETTSSIEEHARARQDASSSLTEEYGGYDILIGKLQELNSVEEKTTGQKAQMQALVSQLSGVIPGLAEAFNAETGSLNMTNAELAEFANKTKEAALAQAAAKDQMEIAEDMYKVEQQMQKATEAADGYKEKMMELSQAGYEGSAAYMDAASGYREASGEIETLTEKSQELEGEYETASDFISSHAEALNGVGEAAAGASDDTQALADATGEVEAVADEAAKAYEALVSSIENASKGFDEFNGGEKMSSDEILKNLQSQTEGMETWAQDMQTLAGRAGDGMTSEFYSYLESAGPQMANAVHSLAGASSEQLSAIVSEWSRSGQASADKYASAVNSAGDKLDTGKLASKAGEATSNAASKIEQGKGQIQNATQSATDPAGVTTDAYTAKGQEAVQKVASGIQQSGSKIKSTLQSQVNSAKGVSTSGFSSIGSSISSGIAGGISSGTPFVTSAVARVIQAAKAKAKAEADVNSPSKLFRDQVGSPISEGIGAGIRKGTKYATEASKQVMKDSLSAAMQEGDIHSPSKKWRDRIGRQMGRGLAMGLKLSKKELKKSASDIASDVTKRTRNYIKKNNLTASMKAYVWSRLEKDAKSSSGKLKKKYKSYFNAIKRESEKQQKAAADSAIKSIRKTAAKNGTAQVKDLQAQINYYKKKTKDAKSYGKAYYAQLKKNADTEVKALQKEIEARREYAASGKAFSVLQTYYETSQKQEVQYWQAMQKNKKLSAEQRLEVDKNYYDAVKDYKEAVLEVQEDYADKVKDINEDLADSIKDLKEEYSDALNDTKKDIFSAYKLTETFLSESQSGEQLLKNLQMQVWGYGEWEKELETIRGKFAKYNLNKELLQELVESGPEATATLRAINELTTEQLKEYSKAYTDKMAIAQKEAVKQNAELKKSTDKQIKEAKEKAKKEIEDARKEAKAQLKEINQTLTPEMQTLTKNAANWGSNAIINFARGMKEQAQRKETWKQATKEVNAALKEAGLASSTKKSAAKKAASTAKKASASTAKAAAKTSASSSSSSKNETSIDEYIEGIASTTGNVKKKFTKAQIKSAGLNKPGKKVELKDVKGHIGSNGKIYFNTKGKKSVVKTWDIGSGKVEKIKYSKADYKKKAKKSVSKYVHQEFADALRNRGVKGYARGGTITELVRMQYGRDQGLIPAQLGETVLSKQFSQDMIPRFTAGIERITAMMESIPTASPINRLISDASAPAANVSDSRVLSLMAGMMALMETYLPDMANMQMVTDTGALVGELSPRISEDWAAIRRRSR